MIEEPQISTYENQMLVFAWSGNQHIGSGVLLYGAGEMVELDFEEGYEIEDLLPTTDLLESPGIYIWEGKIEVDGDRAAGAIGYLGSVRLATVEDLTSLPVKLLAD